MVNLSITEKMEIVLSVGQILAENGATANKIINNVKRVAVSMQIPKENFNLKVMPEVLFLNVSCGEKSHLAFRNYEKHGVDMNIVNLINTLTIKAVKKNYPPQKFNDILNRIVSRNKLYSNTQIIFATGLFCGAFCFLFGGDLLASFYTAIAAIMGKFFQLKSIKYGVNHFCAIAIASFVATSLAYFAHFLPTETMWTPFVACSLFLIPGIPIMNAITESLDGFLLNGMTKAYHSTLIAISIMVGIVLAANIWEHLEEIDLGKVSLLVHHSFVELLFLGIIVSISFSTFINAPKKILLLLGSLGVIALIIKDLIIYHLVLSTEMATFISSLIIGILAIIAKKYTYAPTLLLTVPPIISFVPGVLIFRALSSFVYIRYLNAEQFFYETGFAIDALQIIVAMTVGVTLPYLLANKFLKKNHRFIRPFKKAGYFYKLRRFAK